MFGRILNKALLDRVANLLNVEGVRRFPAVLDMDNIKAVIDIGRAEGVATPGAGQGQWNAYTRVFFLGGTTGFSSQGLLQSAEDGTNAFRVDTIATLLTFEDLAAAAAFAGNTWDVEIGLQFSGGDPGYFPIYSARVVGVATQLQYKVYMQGANTAPGQPNLASSWRGLIPAYVDPFGQGFPTLVVSCNVYGAAVNFPANTTFNTYVTAREGTNGVVPTE